MAGTDVHHARGSKFPIPKGRVSGDSVRRSRAKRNSRSSQAEAGSAWAGKDAGITPSHPYLDESQAPSPFPEFDDQLQPEARYEQTPTSSTKITPRMTPGSSWSTTPNETTDTLDYRAQKGKSGKAKVNIRPMLRKMSRDDAPATSIDLSRSSTDQEGLGIYMNMERDRRQSESLIGTPYRRTSSFHHRSTSGTSQYSTGTGSSGGKPGQSHPVSEDDSDDLKDASSDIDSKPQSGTETPRFVRASSGPVPRLSLQIENDSFTRLPGISQVNASRPSFGYSRDTGSTLDTASPISRNSLDHVFRSRTRTSTDPVSRAATVQAARQAFEEKEAAKARRFEKQQMKSEAKQVRRRVKRNITGEESSSATQTEETQSEGKIPENPKKRNSKHADTDLATRPQPASWKSQSKSTWVLFMTWLRTRLFKFRRKMRKR
ncbi:hypothetical protein N7470_006980 [Penicillium chermesinum]|nr:hypothetical protein N7470_006980 [Penicillium chermesinum]